MDLRKTSKIVITVAGILLVAAGFRRCQAVQVLTQKPPIKADALSAALLENLELRAKMARADDARIDIERMLDDSRRELAEAKLALQSCGQIKKRRISKNDPARFPETEGVFDLPPVTFDCEKDAHIVAESRKPASRPGDKKLSFVRVGSNVSGRGGMSYLYLVAEHAVRPEFVLTAGAANARSGILRHADMNGGIFYKFLGTKDHTNVSALVGVKAGEMTIVSLTAGVSKQYVLPTIAARYDIGRAFAGASFSKSIGGKAHIAESSASAGIRFYSSRSFNLTIGLEHMEKTIAVDQLFSGGVISNSVFIGGEL